MIRSYQVYARGTRERDKRHLATMIAVSPVTFCRLISLLSFVFSCRSSIAVVKRAGGLMHIERGNNWRRVGQRLEVLSQLMSDDLHQHRGMLTLLPLCSASLVPSSPQAKHTDRCMHTKSSNTMPVASRFTASIRREFPPFSSEKHADICHSTIPSCTHAKPHRLYLLS